MRKMVWFLLAIACLIVSAVVYTGASRLNNIIAISFAVGIWFFLIIAAAGRKGLVFGIWIVIFFLCVFIFYWVVLLELPGLLGCKPGSLQCLGECIKGKPYGNALCLGVVVAGIFLIFTLPILATQWLMKRV